MNNFALFTIVTLTLIITSCAGSKTIPVEMEDYYKIPEDDMILVKQTLSDFYNLIDLKYSKESFLNLSKLDELVDLFYPNAILDNPLTLDGEELSIQSFKNFIYNFFNNIDPGLELISPIPHSDTYNKLNLYSIDRINRNGSFNDDGYIEVNIKLQRQKLVNSERKVASINVKNQERYVLKFLVKNDPIRTCKIVSLIKQQPFNK